MKAYNWISATMPDTGGWKGRHKHAVEGFSPIAAAMRAWCQYAAEHENKFESKIGDDYVLGPAWARWGFALRELLNGDCGTLDCGTLDSILGSNLSEQGYNLDDGAP